MATSGSKSVSVTSWDTLKFSWSEVSQSVESNSTTISWKMELVAGDYGRISATSTCAWEVTVNGTKYSGKVNVGIGNNETKTLASGTTTIAHNSDGTKTFSYSFSQYFGITFSNEWIATVSGSGSGTLDTIARASQPSCITWPEHTQNVGYFGDAISIHMNRNSSSFTHTVRYQFGTASGTIATGVGTGTTWVIPLSLMDLIPNTTSGSGTIYVDTYNGSTKIGTKSCGFTAKVPDSVKPTCTLALDDIMNIDDVYGSPVKGLSKIKVTVTGKTAYSSPIASYEIVANGVRYTGSTATTGVLNTSGKSTVTAKVTDKRGRVGTVSYDMNVLAYAQPVISALDVRRCNQDGSANEDGAYVKVTFSAAISSMSSKNTALYTLGYKKASASSYTSVSLTALANKYSVTNHEYIFAADAESSYDVTITAADRHKTVSRSTSASTAFTLIDLHPSGNGLRFGGIAEEQNAFQNDLVFIQKGNQYCFSSIGEASTDGYILMARITVTATNSDTPITFEFSRRKATAPMRVHILFNSTADTDPGLSSIRYEGDNYDAYLTKSAASVWDLYVKKVSNSDTITLNRWGTSYRQMNRIAIEFPGNLVSTVPTGLLGYYKATPLVSRSIMDCFFPVGYIMLLYSHADPNTMYPGTTWQRISGAFPWFTDEKGTIGQTGGASEVKLTTAQIPSHTHGSVYSGNASGDKTLPWLSTSVLGTGDKLAYSTIATGGSEAHENMPPYIQISAWRRTA